MKLGGWQRIGILLSAIWLTCSLSFAFYEYYQMQEERSENLSIKPRPPARFVIEPQTQAYFFKWSDPKTLKDTEFVYNIEPVYSRFVLIVLVPVFCWLFVFSTVSSCRWVKAGFKNK